jgi:hypothetical protein
MKNKMVNITIGITKKQKEWLDNHDLTNSELVRRGLEIIMQQEMNRSFLDGRVEK